MRSTFRRFLAASLVLLMAVPTTVLAQGTVGTVRGKVVDTATGDALAAVNISVLQIDGTATTMGAMTNAQGEYVIINVPPGRYQLRATMMGFKDVLVEDLMVTVGVSTRHDFRMEQTVLDVGETIIVEAEREMIQRDVTGTQQSYTIEQMERMAVSNTTDILALQTNAVTVSGNFNDDIPGYYDRGLEQVHMRGGRNAEVAFMIDGMQVTNLVFGGQAANVSPFSLSEMVVMAGGMSAEFGNAMSGVVNMVTREGGTTYDANVEYRTSELTGQPQDDVLNLNTASGYVGGPVPYVDRLTFFLSGSATSERDYIVKRDDIVYDFRANPLDPDWWANKDPNITYSYLPSDPAAFDPDIHSPYLDQIGPDGRRIHGTDVYAGWLGYGFNNDWDVMLNSTYKFTPSMKLNASGQTNGRWGMPYTDVWRHAITIGMPEWLENYLVLGYPEYWTGIDGDAYVANPYIVDTTILDPMGNPVNPEFDQAWRIDSSGNTDFENEKNILFNNNYRGAFVFTHQLDPKTFYSLRGAYYSYNRTMRVKRWENAAGWARRMEHTYVGLHDDITDPLTYGTPNDPYWQPGDEMELVTLRWILGGYDADDDFLRRYGYYPYSSSGAGLTYEGSDRYYTNHHDRTRTWKGDITSQVTTNHQVKAGAQYNVLTLDMQDVQFPWSLSPSETRYVKHPWEFAMYLQDKVEYDFLIINMGVRYDGANSGPTKYWIDPRNPVNPDTTLSPEDRLIADPYDYAFTPPVTSGATHSNLSPRIGISHPVTDEAMLYFNYGHFYQQPIYRNVYRVNNIARSNPITGNPGLEAEKTVSYEFGYKHQFTELYSVEGTLWAKDTSNLVGTERVPAWFQGNINPHEYTVAVNYDYASSKGFDLSLNKRYSDFWSARVNYSYMTTQSNRDDPWQGYRDGADGTLERQPKRPRVLGWDQPHRFSSSITISTPQNVGPEVFGIRPLERLSANIIYRAAAGRPYTPTTEIKTLEQNSGRRPWTFQWDMRLYKDLESFGLRYSVFADIRNVFDRKNVTSVFSRTGKPDDPGPDATSYSDNYDRWHYYGIPRTITMGLRVRF